MNLYVVEGRAAYAVAYPKITICKPERTFRKFAGWQLSFQCSGYLSARVRRLQGLDPS